MDYEVIKIGIRNNTDEGPFVDPGSGDPVIQQRSLNKSATAADFTREL
jgi:hypothetical protein